MFFGDISWNFLNPSSKVPVRYHTMKDEVIGGYVGTNVKAFAEKLYDTAEKAIEEFYKESMSTFGEIVDEISSEVFNKTIWKLIEKTCGGFTDGTFKLLKNLPK